jgi:hypothetical protein
MTFIVLDDITSGMKKPCVMDVKIGLQTWEPGCSEKKKKDENVIKLLNLYFLLIIVKILYYLKINFKLFFLKI